MYDYLTGEGYITEDEARELIEEAVVELEETNDLQWCKIEHLEKENELLQEQLHALCARIITLEKTDGRVH
jgi:polyhydroxyalkanoate synthesis regulator phasin